MKILQYSLAVMSFLMAFGSSHAQNSLMASAQAIKWNTENAVALEQEFSSASATQDFVSEVLEKNPDYAEPPQVTEHMFVDLNGDGHLALLCILDVSGRGRSRGLVAIMQSGIKFKTAFVEAGGILENLPKMVIDIHNDGKKEILISQWLSLPKTETDPIAAINDVYMLLDGKLVEVDKQFPDYYRNIALPQTQHELAEAEGAFGTRPRKAKKLIAALKQEIMYEEKLAGTN